MHTAVESTSDRGTDPPPMRIQPPSIHGQAPVGGTLAGRPAATLTPLHDVRLNWR